MKRIFIVTLMLALVLGVAQGAWAQWPDDPSANLLLCNRSGEGTITKVSPAPDGGCYVSWWDNTSGHYCMYLQRLDGDGVTQWADNGLLISNHAQDTWLTDYDLDTDSAGYAILAINDIRAGGDWDIYAYRISPEGDFAWGADGLTISDNAAFEAIPSSVVTAAGNIVITWQEENIIHIRKVTPEGTDFWNPPTITLTYTYALSIPKLCPALDDEFILQYLKAQGSGMYAPKHLYARKYDANGANLWTEEGVIVTNAGGFGLQMRPDIISDEAGGAFSYWYDSRSNVLHAFVQHIQHDGAMLWTANGVQLNTTSGELQMSPVITYLPASDRVIAFFENTNSSQTIQGLYAQSLNSTGQRQWGNGGEIIHAMDNSTKMLLQADRMENDAVVTYLKTPLNDAVNTYVQCTRVDFGGNQVWDLEPVIISTTLSSKGYLDACVNNRDQVIAVWEDKRSDPDGDVYLQNINPDGLLGPLTPPAGVLEGNVREPDGTTGLADVLVTTYDSLQVVAIDTTNSFGMYSIILPPGTYYETFSKPGYRDTTITDLVVTDGHSVTVNLNMQLAGGCSYVVGDVNNNGIFNGIDVTYGVGYFKGGNPPTYSCDCNGSVWFVAGDVNGNCQFNGIDVTYMVSFFKGGAVPIPCPACPPSR